MDDIDEITQDIILDYLKAEYPVTKLRDGRRFKRGIVLDGVNGNDKGFGFLKPNEELKKTFNGLFNSINDMFGVSHYEINVVILRYLDLL